VQHQVTLVGRPFQPHPHRLELEGQVVAERPVQAQVRVLAAERRDDLAERAEHGGAAAALLFGVGPVRFGDVHGYVSGGASRRVLHWRAGPLQRGRDHRQHHPAPVVQGAGADAPAAGHDLQARVGVGDVPPAVPARVLHARAEHAAAPVVDGAGDRGQPVRVERPGGAGDPHAAAGLEVGSHISRFGVHVGTFVRARPRRERKNDRRMRAVVMINE
jgi:hypothetical protein